MHSGVLTIVVLSWRLQSSASGREVRGEDSPPPPPSFGIAYLTWHGVVVASRAPAYGALALQLFLRSAAMGHRENAVFGGSTLPASCRLVRALRCPSADHMHALRNRAPGPDALLFWALCRHADCALCRHLFAGFGTYTLNLYWLNTRWNFLGRKPVVKGPFALQYIQGTAPGIEQHYDE